MLSSARRGSSHKLPFAVELSGLFGVFMVLVGTWGFLAPRRLTELVLRFATKSGLFVAVAIRLAIGVALWFAAPHSRGPFVLKVLSVLMVVAALALSFMGLKRYEGLIEWWARLSAARQRGWTLLAIAVGATVLWTLLPSVT